MVIPDSMLSGVKKKKMLTAAQARRKEQMSKSYAATPALVMTQQVAEEARPHTIRWKAVGDKYAEYVHLMSSVLLVDFPALPVVDGAPDEVEPWPKNGLRYARRATVHVVLRGEHTWNFWIQNRRYGYH